MQVELTANHEGYFEFKLCPKNDVRTVTEQACLDRYPLVVVEAENTTMPTRYYIPEGLKKTVMIDLKVRLPRDVFCSQCVLQWYYRSGRVLIN